MARTKQTARLNPESKAPRKQLATKAGQICAPGDGVAFGTKVGKTKGPKKSKGNGKKGGKKKKACNRGM